MSNKNDPISIKHESHKDTVEQFAEILTLGLFEAPTHHKTTVTGPSDGTYTGYGYTEEAANKEAGDKYRNGKSDE